MSGTSGWSVLLMTIPDAQTMTGGSIELEEIDVPFEGHSVTLRDILLKAGTGEVSFRLTGASVVSALCSKT